LFNGLKIISTSYTKTESFNDPQQWLQRINFYTGILKELAKENDVTSIERINYEGELRDGGVSYHFIDLKKRVVRFPWKMHSYIRKQKPHLVLVNGLAFPLQIIQLRFVLGKDVKIVLLHRAEKPFSGIKKYIQRMADKYVNAYLFTSTAFGQQWGKNINVKKIHEVVQASSVFQIEDKQLARVQLQLNSSPIFLWVGRLDSNKDPLTVVKAFLKFLAYQPSAMLYMIFQTNELLEEVEKMVAESKNIVLVGKVEHNKLQSWHSAADFIISGSHYEGNGISVIEAMSCGCIPIVTDINSFRGMTRNGNCGMLYEPGNDKELLMTLLKTEELDIQKESEKVLEQFNNELSFQAIRLKIEKVIESINVS